MVGLKKYKIDIFNLPPGEHEYEFDFTSEFFSNFENSLIENGKGIVKVNLLKSETFLDLGFKIQGSTRLICDRSLDPFDYPLKIEKNLILKFGEEPEGVIEDEIVFIPWKTQSIDMSQYIYEFICLEIPMKKVHPRFKEESESDEQQLIYSSVPDVSESSKEETGDLDPRWQKLKNLKDKN